MTGLALLLSLAYLGLAFWAPGALSNLLGLVALGAAAFLRLSPQARTLSLALLTLAFTLGLWRSGNTLGLIGLVGILVALTTLPRIPNWIRALLASPSSWSPCPWRASPTRSSLNWGSRSASTPPWP